MVTYWYFTSLLPVKVHLSQRAIDYLQRLEESAYEKTKGKLTASWKITPQQQLMLRGVGRTSSHSSPGLVQLRGILCFEEEWVMR
jgi:hypothetical protein